MDGLRGTLAASLAALVLGALLAALVVAPEWGQLGAELPGVLNDDGLGALHLHHDFHDALREGRLSLVDPDQLVPAGSDRWLREGGNSLEMLVSGAFRLVLPWPLWLTVGGLAWIPLNLLAFLPLGRHLWGRWGPALAAGAAWAVLPPALEQLATLRLTQLVLVGLPIAVLGFLRIGEGRRGGWWICGLGMALTAAGYWFYGYFMVLLAPVFLAWAWRQRGREAVLAIAKAAGLALALCLPLLSRPLWVRLSGGWMPSNPATAEFSSPVFEDALQLSGPQAIEGWCPWVLLIGFGATAMWGRRRALFGVLALICVVFAMGPAQKVGEWLWLLPSYPLWRWLPGFDRQLHPDRWIHVAGLFMVLLAADGLARKQALLTWLLPVGVMAQVGLSRLPLGSWDPTPPAVWQAVQATEGQGVIVVPLLESPLSCAWQPFHGKRLLGGMGENQPWFRPPVFEAFIEGNGLLMQLWLLGRGEDQRIEVVQQDLDGLREQGLDLVVLDAGAWAHAPLAGAVDGRRRLVEAFGEPLSEGASGALWRLPTQGRAGAPRSYGPLRSEGPPGGPPAGGAP